MNSFNFKSYFKFLSRNKGYTAVNLIGFSISLMFVILLALYIRNESQFDRFHENKDRIYRLTTDKIQNFAPPVPVDLQNRYPEIEKFTRVKGGAYTVKKSDEKIRSQCLFVDSTFFQLFSFAFPEGDPASQLRIDREVVLTESFAVKLFADESPIGKTIDINNSEFIVSGVVKDFENTHFSNPDFFIRYDCLGEWNMKSYNAADTYVYFLIRENSDFASQLADATEYLKSYWWVFKNGVANELKIEPLVDCHFNTKLSGQSIYEINSRDFIWILGLSGLAILLFAIINYINLSVAQSGFRAKEAATRRLLGGSRNGLFFSYISEAVLFCAGAFVIAILLALLTEPTFNQLLKSNISIFEILTPINILIAVLFILLLGGVSGIIPALTISRFKPIEVVKGDFKRKTKMVYGKIFICFQFWITIVLLGCAYAIIQQTRYMRNADLGFNKEQLIHMQNTLSPERLPGLRDKLMQVPGVKMVAFSSGTPHNGGNNQTVIYEDGKTISFQAFGADDLFLDILDLEIVHTTGIKADSAVWINQAAFAALELSGDDHMFDFYDDKLAVAGVVKDFNVHKLTREISPVIIMPSACYGNRYFGSPWDILVKVESYNPAEIYEQVLASYLDYNGGTPVKSGFVDAEINSWYNEQERTGKIIGYFSLLAIIISALGLLAMATYFMRQRALDVAVRKVFGSTNEEILKRLIFSFMKIVLVSFVIAIPVIWYAMDKWLQGYAYHIRINWTIFAVAGGIAFVIAFITVFWQSYKATNANPIQSLKKD